MSTASPTAFLLWAIISILFLGFLIYHLWCYDRFQCLKWSSGRQPGAFKRVMTYSYLGAVPLFVAYSVGTTVIKYQEGFIALSDNDIIPVPLNYYRLENHRWIVPLNFLFSIAWGLELVTHLEELAFWLYLLHQRPDKTPWFSSWEYRLWYNGSLVAIVGMPLTTFIKRADVVRIDAFIFLVGGSGSTVTTLATLYVLWRFPRFIKHVKDEGADPTVVVRLATFYQLNQARVVFRFMFTIPLLILAGDGIAKTRHPINSSLFWTDFLLMIAGIGCFVSTTITLLIFFPRSITNEAGYKPRPHTTVNSPKSAPITPPAPFNTRQSGMQSPQSEAFSPSTSQGGHFAVDMLPRDAWAPEEEEEGEEEYEDEDEDRFSSASTVEPELGYTEAGDDDAPPYARPRAQPTLHQRHPFPHSLSSPQIPAGATAAPPSPEVARVSMPPRARQSTGKHRYSFPLPAEAMPGYAMGLGLGTATAEVREVRREPRRERRASARLHPYVMTFTSPIDLADLSEPETFPRTTV